jgi:hypothetical protein
MKSKNFGEETIIIGEETERFSALDGARIRTTPNLPLNETGTIKKILINRQAQTVQIWADMDKGYTRAFRPRHIEFIDKVLSQHQAKLLSRGD